MSAARASSPSVVSGTVHAPDALPSVPPAPVLPAPTATPGELPQASPELDADLDQIQREEQQAIDRRSQEELARLREMQKSD